MRMTVVGEDWRTHWLVIDWCGGGRGGSGCSRLGWFKPCGLQELAAVSGVRCLPCGQEAQAHMGSSEWPWPGELHPFYLLPEVGNGHCHVSANGSSFPTPCPPPLTGASHFEYLGVSLFLPYWAITDMNICSSCVYYQCVSFYVCTYFYVCIYRFYWSIKFTCILTNHKYIILLFLVSTSCFLIFKTFLMVSRFFSAKIVSKFVIVLRLICKLPYISFSNQCDLWFIFSIGLVVLA